MGTGINCIIGRSLMGTKYGIKPFFFFLKFGKKRFIEVSVIKFYLERVW
jgi:hypothetical protein